MPRLLEAFAASQDDRPVVTLPDGRKTLGPGKDTDALLSDWLDTPVVLMSSADDAGRAEFFADATDDSSQAIEWTMPHGRYVDAAPVLVLTTASLRTAAALHPDGDWDVRRFRPNVLLDVDGDGWVEDAWVGASLTVGSTTLLPLQACVRCTMVTRRQPGLEEDRDIFRTLARNHGGLFGMWCAVAAPGELRLGDAATLAPR